MGPVFAVLPPHLAVMRMVEPGIVQRIAERFVQAWTTWPAWSAVSTSGGVEPIGLTGAESLIGSVA